MAIFCSIILLIINVSNQGYRENQNTHFMLSNFSFVKNRAACEIMKNVVKVTDKNMAGVLRAE